MCDEGNIWPPKAYQKKKKKRKENFVKTLQVTF